MAVDTPVKSIMTTSLITCDQETDVGEIARLIWENNISSIPIVEQGKVIGMVTDYDLISRHTEFDGPIYLPFIDVYFQVPGTGDPEQLRRILATTARELMSYPILTVTPDDSVQDAATIMYEHRINAIPVVDEDELLVGIITRADIVQMIAIEEARYLAQSL
ncbi:MAG: CBS domain-containing protein, partial [Thermomicrobiaceae bacterium]